MDVEEFWHKWHKETYGNSVKQYEEHFGWRKVAWEFAKAYAAPIAPVAASEIEQFKQVLSSEIYGFLKHDCIDILNLVFEHQISPGKAAEAIAERKLGFDPKLPALKPEAYG